jgi:hypothetical protein
LIAVGEYLYGQVKWVNNIMPDRMDLNRLFATMNTRGVQLEQTDILKSKLMHKITHNKSRYDAIWQACENLDNYFERNVRQIFPDADWNSLSCEQLAEYNDDLFPLEEQREDHEWMTISQLVSEKPEEERANAAQEEDEIYCRSIISFGLLLMHAFRIYRKRRGKNDFEARVNDDRLNECFSTFVERASEKDAIGFIECLWQVRYQFDRWVVKWVARAEDDEKHLRLSSVSLSKSNNGSRLTRAPLKPSNLTQLQSVRYFTGERSAQYWLTPFLGLLVEKKLTDRDKVEKLLERIDNQLSLALKTQKEASFSLLSEGCQSMRSIESVCKELKEPRGTSFEHYWFQKLEYILWREQNNLECFDPKKLARYRITSKNSVEHVYPQNEEHGRELNNSFLHAFGNLVLLSPGENSSYSNQTVRKKRADFVDKPRYDALKLAHVFHVMEEEGEWNEDAISRHQTAMLDLIKQHYSRRLLKKSVI